MSGLSVLKEKRITAVTFYALNIYVITALEKLDNTRDN